MGVVNVFKIFLFGLQVTLLSIVFCLCNALIMLKVPVFHKMVIDKMSKLSTLKNEDFVDSLFSFEMLETCMKQIWLDVFKTIKKGCTVEAGRFTLCSVSMEQSKSTDERVDGMDSNGNYQQYEEPSNAIPSNFVSLASLARKDVPLVLNFGSCS